MDIALHTSIYSLNWFAGMIAGLVLLPVYTHELTVQEYGIIDLVNQSSALVRGIVASAFTYSLANFYHKAEGEDQKSRTIWTSAICISLLGVLCGLVMVVFNNSLTVGLLNDPAYCIYLYLAAASVAVDFLALGFSNQFLVEKKSLIFVAIGVFRLVLAICFNLICLWVFRIGGLGMIVGGVVASLLSAFATIYICSTKYKFAFDFSISRAMFRFGLPMMPATALAIFLHQGDRFLLNRLVGLDSLGLYIMACQFPSMLNSLLLTSFNYVWGGDTLFKIERRADFELVAKKISSTFIGLYLGLQSALIIVSPIVFALLVDKKFHASLDLIPMISLAYSVHAVYIFFVSRGFVTGKLVPMVIAYLVPCVFKVVFVVVLARHFGLHGVALSLMLSYLVFIIMCYLLFAINQEPLLDFASAICSYLMFFGLCCLVSSDYIFGDSNLLRIAAATLAPIAYLLVPLVRWELVKR